LLSILSDSAGSRLAENDDAQTLSAPFTSLSTSLLPTFHLSATRQWENAAGRLSRRPTRLLEVSIALLGFHSRRALYEMEYPGAPSGHLCTKPPGIMVSLLKVPWHLEGNRGRRLTVGSLTASLRV
jgi:hypothetical protein